jgi:hypothetical protein
MQMVRPAVKQLAGLAIIHATERNAMGFAVRVSMVSREIMGSRAKQCQTVIG